ncbi:hypothetical protein AAG570_011330 [Ranatra chinensis]|uniref:Uncharacterized protein n=1 Tax=Ranatra chinensis TaxID=642074 RepID=A0ABD0YKG4_9HEMI
MINLQGGPLQTPTTASKPTQSVPITIPSLQTSSAGNIATQPGNLWGSSTVLQTSSPSATQQTSGQLQGTPLFQQTGQKVTSATQQKSSTFQQTPAQHPLVPQVPNFQQNSTQQQQAFNSSQPQQAFNSSQPQQTFNSSQPQQAFNSSQPQLTFNSSQPQQALNSSQQSQSLNSQQQQQALNSSQSQQTFNSQQQQALNSSQQQQALNSQQQSMLSQHFSAQPQPMFHKTHSQTTDKDAPPQSSIQQEPLPLNNSPQQHPSPVLFQARQQKPQQLSSAKHKAIVPPSSPMVSSPQPPTPTGKSPSFKPPIDALQRTMEPQAFNFSLGQGKESEAVNKVSGTKVVNLSSKDLEKKYRAGIRAEIKNFAAELKILKRIVNSVNINIGDDEQKNKLKVQTENLESFGKDLRETTASQEAEVSALKVNLVETYNWFENIRGKHLQLTDSKYSSLKESNELDPISRQHIKSIEKNLTFLESNVRSIIGDLETMWTEKKDDYRKRSELETPTLETIFQSIMTIYKLINQQKMVVTGLENNLPLKMKKKLHHPDFKIMKEKKLHITGDTELSKLAEKLLNTKLGEVDDMNTSVSAGSKCFNKLPSSKHLTSTQEKKIQEWHKKYNGVHTVVVKKKTVTSDMLFSTSDESSKPVLAQNNIKFNELDQENGEIIFSGTPMPKSPMASLLPDNLSSPEMVNPVSNILHDTPNSFPKHPHSMKGVFSYNSQNKLIANVNEGISIDEPPAEGSGGLFNMAKHIHATPEKQISQNSLLPENGSMFIQNTVLSGIGQTDFNSKQVAPKLENSVTFSGANSPVPIKSGTTTTEPFTEKNASENTKLSFGIHNAGLKNDENKTMGKNEIKSLSGEGDTGIKLSDVSSGTPLFSNSIFSKQAQVSSSSKNIFTFPSSTTPASSSGNITLSDLGTSLATLSTSGVSQANEPSANKDSLDKTSSSFSFNFSSINTNQPLTKPLLKTPELTTVPSTVTAQQANTKSTSSAFSFARLSPNTNQKGNAQVSQPSGSMFGTVSTSSFSFGGKIAENSASSRQPPDSAVALKSEASTFKEDPASKPTLPISLSSETPSVPPQTPVVTSQSAISEPNKPAMPAFSSLDISSKSGGSFFGSQSSFVSQPTALLPTPTAGVDQKLLYLGAQQQPQLLFLGAQQQPQLLFMALHHSSHLRQHLQHHRYLPLQVLLPPQLLPSRFLEALHLSPPPLPLHLRS